MTKAYNVDNIYLCEWTHTHTLTYDVTYLYTYIYLRDKHVCQTQTYTFSKICVALQRLFAISFLSSIQFIWSCCYCSSLSFFSRSRITSWNIWQNYNNRWSPIRIPVSRSRDKYCNGKRIWNVCIVNSSVYAVTWLRCKVANCQIRRWVDASMPFLYTKRKSRWHRNIF